MYMYMYDRLLGFYLDHLIVWIVEQPQSVYKYIGESATLCCRAEGKGPIKYMWLKTLEDGKKERISEFSSNGTLNFDVLESRVWGSYTCQAQNEDDFVASNTVSVRFRAKNDASKRMTSLSNSVYISLLSHIFISFCVHTCTFKLDFFFR